jgi:hypothetical protein
MAEQKICRNIHLASYPTTTGVPAAEGHSVSGGANSRLYCSVGSDSCRRGARRQESQCHGPRCQETPGAMPHGGSVLVPWGTVAASPL